ncbi:acyl carrier protein [Alienimonas californiensis]|uniref:Acyl carrier protein n=1 Tax=Alienimonas californiensis TaxID=2527989 RepID=A0A517PCT3_9PLAN|nr:acyl carrier protein [Alienimonas californiensis]QDT17180.1 acyl carrier protein [Alienimonas californiensis]
MTASQASPDAAHPAPAIRAFVHEQFPLAAQRDLSDDDSLLDSGAVDSLGILDLVGFLESRFEIQIADEDVVGEHFDSVAAMAEFVESKRAGI